MVENGQIICDDENPKDLAKASYKKLGGGSDAGGETIDLEETDLEGTDSD